jgi:predicted metal-dependent peptidase
MSTRKSTKAAKPIDKQALCTLMIGQVTDKWFMREPALLMALLSHSVKVNDSIQGIRCGQGRIEYNSDYVSRLSDEQVEEQLKIEVIRILLRHPYRQPPGYDVKLSYMASNITLNEYYPFKNLPYKASDFWQPAGYIKKYFEFYYQELQKIKSPGSGGNENKTQEDTAEKDRTEARGNNKNAEKDRAEARGNNENAEKDQGEASGNREHTDSEHNDNGNSERTAFENAALWEEDEYMDKKIVDIITFAQQNLSWGTISGSLKETLIASLRTVIDYRKVLKGFRASILSSDKTLTRFKPSRRYGFLSMGKKSVFTTKLLFGVDVSGSLSVQEISRFYSTINRFFKYGIQSLDVLQFDTEIKGELVSLQKAQKTVAVLGRGGTDFQSIIDYFLKARKTYDGLIIFTDGYAEHPKVPAEATRKILWICNSTMNYERHHPWMRKLGRCCWIE